jgi:nicotinamide-nucleotide amidase
MPTAEILTIGTEILLGEILDTNAQYIARALRQAGINLYRKTTIGDNTGRIAQTIREALERADILITTGGLGPTVDDPTRQAAALALGVESEYHPELWQQIEERFKRYGRQPTENNRRQAYIPAGAIPLENPVGTAPCFIAETGEKCLIALPGVPREMEYLLDNSVIPYLRRHYDLHGTIKTRVLHTAGVGESIIDDLIGELETLSNPTVGLAAHSGQVDVRIAANAESEAEAEALIAPVEASLRHKLGEWIYGSDQETLESVALSHLQAHGWQLVVVEAGLNGELSRRLAALPGSFLGSELLATPLAAAELVAATEASRLAHGAEVGLGVALHPGGEKQEIYLVLITPDGIQQFTRPYGGAPANAPRYALHHSLDILRHA